MFCKKSIFLPDVDQCDAELAKELQREERQLQKEKEQEEFLKLQVKINSTKYFVNRNITVTLHV